MMMQSLIQSVKLSGSARKRGQMRGEILKPMIWEQMERLKAQTSLSDSSTQAYVETFFKQTTYSQAVEKWTPDLLEEVRGISEGCGIPFEEIFILSCLDETWRFSQSRQGIASMGCTSLGCDRTGSSPTLLGQNLDTDIHFRNLVVLLHIEEENGLEYFMITYPGSIGIGGMSKGGIGICVNTINLQSSTEGLPLQFRVREVLRKKNKAEAGDFLKGIQHGAAQNIMIGDREGVVDYECSANQAVQFIPYPGARRVYHANHHLANFDIIPNYATILDNSLARMKYLEFRLKDESKPVALENMQGILRSHLGPICYHAPNMTAASNTLYSVVYVLGDHPELYLAIGNPCLSDYQKFTFEKY
jgi:isopenicillin-N N-acyltransferase like protein